MDTLGAAMREAGLRNVSEQECRLPWDFRGSGKRMWEMWYDIAAPYRPIVDDLHARTRAELIEGVRKEWDPRQTGPFLHLGVRVVVGVGEKA
ncbi:hypothetical protein CALCODRAFT_557268 [Calocera cornea HHB12733]|uniref:Uncharacterized protein n=1 Tax=Calocera cornea HHB12733 TaxID=1353952 RepID=A0A165E1F7_9BASI|nr:hypothetical protein CALCODRAFT_557268 [Calocera cornea HHB12733]